MRSAGTASQTLAAADTTTGPFNIRVPIGPNDERVVVAVAVGVVKLAVAVKGPAAGFESLQIEYRKDNKNVPQPPVVEKLMPNVTTQVGHHDLVSEVAVHLKGKTQGEFAEITVTQSQ